LAAELGIAARQRPMPLLRIAPNSSLYKGQEYLPTVARIHERMLESSPGLQEPDGV
jgi:hypothetical protein